MVSTSFRRLVLCAVLFRVASLGAATRELQLATMPRVDVHAHVGTVDAMEGYVQVSSILKKQYGANLAVWIDLSFLRAADAQASQYLRVVKHRFDDRFLPCINDYDISDGLRYDPNELKTWQQQGVVGYKIWVGVSSLIDDPMSEPTFSRMEQIGMLGASVHISQPYPTKWCDDAVKFWQAHNAWERVLDRHPRLTVVQAHMLDHFNSNEQLDYLTYVLESYPQVHLDLGARFQQFHRMDREKLRGFIVKYADRILFGTDISRQPTSEPHPIVAQRYHRCFQLLETDNVTAGGFFGNTETKGLDLPLAVLKKLYYQNAMRLYPRVKEVLIAMGYDME